jgi:hypothetical protein
MFDRHVALDEGSIQIDHEGEQRLIGCCLGRIAGMGLGQGLARPTQKKKNYDPTMS